MNEHIEDFDFKALGQAIKKAREAKDMTREQLAAILDVAPRHIQAVENEGQHPSFQLFIRLVTMFDISVDQYIFTDKVTAKSTLRRQIDAILDGFDDKELTVIEGTAKGICKAKEQTEE
ncbi:MAG: helix-turn-helix transcriptional regulator [Oscillospiraceae bacterium]|jgi:transcriptional regulator with XRE-family HTH domain|nr:helix-turn-helix transcriptional regulator [Oscillospiraceae bacterium]